MFYAETTTPPQAMCFMPLLEGGAFRLGDVLDADGARRGGYWAFEREGRVLV